MTMRNYRNQPSGTVSRARALRREASPAEKKLLRALRENFPAAKFRHQTPVRPFYVDLFSFSEQLIIEVDGESHGTTKEQDAARTRYIEAQGYRVIRFWNNDVDHNLEGVLTIIANAVTDTAQNFSAADAAGPHPNPPHKGEGTISQTSFGVR